MAAWSVHRQLDGSIRSPPAQRGHSGGGGGPAHAEMPCHPDSASLSSLAGEEEKEEERENICRGREKRRRLQLPSPHHPIRQSIFVPIAS